jgi:hypothetical protein
MYFGDPIIIISRPKLFGGGTHWGVLLPDGRVVHCTDQIGVEMLPGIDAFAQGHDVTILYEVPAHLNGEVYRRINAALSQSPQYHLMKWNCEVFANWVTCRKPESPQVSGWTFIAVTAALVSAIRAR